MLMLILTEKNRELDVIMKAFNLNQMCNADTSKDDMEQLKSQKLNTKNAWPVTSNCYSRTVIHFVIPGDGKAGGNSGANLSNENVSMSNKKFVEESRKDFDLNCSMMMKSII